MGKIYYMNTKERSLKARVFQALTLEGYEKEESRKEQGSWKRQAIKKRTAREILALMGYKALFEYIPEMEISVPDSDKRNSLDKIAYYYRSEEIVLSDLYIGYVIALYKYTIPKIVAESIQVIGGLWPQKRVPRNIDRDALLSRIKKMCSMGMLRCFVYTKDGNNIVLYSTTPEFCKVIFQALKLNTDARHEKDILPPWSRMN